MDQDPYMSNDDNEDLAEIEHRLYAQIHHQLDDVVDKHYEKDNDTEMADAQNNNEGTSAVSSNLNANKKQNRYWSLNKEQSYKMFYKSNKSGIYNALTTSSALCGPNDPINPTGSRLKPFTPYTSLLSDTNIVAVGKTSNRNSTALKTTSKLIKNKRSRLKRKNPFSNQSIFNANAYDNLNKSVPSTSVLNPLSLTNRKRKQPDKISKQSEKNNGKKPEVSIDLQSDDNDGDEDDDVIHIPNKPPPLILIDSSDDETNTTNDDEHEFTEPQVTAQQNNKKANSSRCVSPTNSTMSCDDFIIQTDRRRVELDAFTQDELYEISTAVDNCVNQSSDIPSTSGNNGTEVIFVAPRKASKSKQTPKSYAVSENSFAAIDVYESESSDFTDTVYAKGNQSKRKKVSSSSSDSDGNDNSSVNKTKRLRKRKSSGSNKGSDYFNSDEFSSDENEADWHSNNSNSLPYLVRGEALGKVNKKIKNAVKRKTRTISEKHSDDDFITTLSSIVHAANDEDDNLDLTQEVVETVAARDIVESVLEQRNKKSKRLCIETVVDNEDMQNNLENNWVVKDHVLITEVSVEDVSNDISTEQIIESPDVISEECTIEGEKNLQVAAVAETAAANVKEKPNQQQLIVKDTSNKCVPGYTSVVSGEIGWNEEMIYFYNKSWGGELFNTHRKQTTMPKTFSDWPIISADRAIPMRDYRRNRARAARCMNCREKGHRTFDCPLPPNPSRCYMCGNTGHSEPRCPNTLCFWCGEKTNTFTYGCNKCEKMSRIVCYVCHKRGHRATRCPDKWRRYHTTTQANVPLTEHIRPLPNKPKYCCICASKGHLAEQCRSADRFTKSPISSVFIKNYQTTYRVKFLEDDEDQQNDEFVTFSSIENDYSFNYEDDVTNDCNAFYNRFKRAVRLDERLAKKRKAAQRLADKNKTMIMELESISDVEKFEAADGSKHDLPAEAITSDGTNVDLINITAPTVVEEAEQEKQETATELEIVPEQNNKEANDMSSDDDNDDKLKKLAELAMLEQEMLKLNRLKEELILNTTSGKSSNKNNSSHTHTEEVHDSDSNYSFSEFYTDATGESANLVKLPDYIPLESNDPTTNKFDDKEPVANQAANQTDESLPAETKCEAKIYLTAEHSRYLVTTQGDSFLKNKSKEHGVLVRMEWRSVGNILIVNGLPSSQDKFHADLIEFFEKIETKIKNRNDVGIPKNRQNLIRYLRSTVGQLENTMGNARDIYERMCRYNAFNTKASKKHAERLRKELNMILIGKCGLRDGNRHLVALQDKLRELTESSEQNVSISFRKDLVEHLNYIFSSVEHDNYADLMQQYIDLKRMKSLPTLNLDRRLLGLKINVKLDDSHASVTENIKSQTEVNNTSQIENNTGKTVQTIENVETAADSSLLDIQINVTSKDFEWLNEQKKQLPATKRLPKQKTLVLCEGLTGTGSEDPNTPSKHWSQRCLEFLKPLLDCPHTSSIAYIKINRYIRQAENNQLTAGHYTALSKIFARMTSDSQEHAKTND